MEKKYLGNYDRGYYRRLGRLDMGTGQGSLFRKLVSSVASSSWLVEELLLTADTLALERSSDIKVHECLAKRRSPVATVMRAIAIGLLFDTESETASAYQEYGFACDKEDWYAGAFMWKLIFALRHGASKKEAFIVENVSSFKGFVEDDLWNERSSILGVLIRAWGASYGSYDFDSALIVPWSCRVRGV